MTTRRIALVLAAGSNGLGAVRSLSARRIETYVVCRSRLEPAFLSRLPSQKMILGDGRDFCTRLGRLLATLKGKVDCVIPTSDEYAAALQHLASQSQLPIPHLLPPDGLVDQLNDKKSEIRLIRKAGVPLPRTSLDLCLGAASHFDLTFPVIVKPRTYGGMAILGAKNRILYGHGALDAFRKEFHTELDQFLAQEIVPGDETHQWVCNATFDHESNLISAFTFQRLGTVPFRFGVTTFAVSRHNADVKRLCSQLGRSLHYRGSAMFEFKRDPVSKQYFYIEINPRLGMCNWFDSSCRVNNVYNSYALAVGLKPDVNVDQQIEGVTYLNLPMDLYARVKARQPLKEIARLYRTQLGRTSVVFPTWSFRDPLPVLSHSMQIAARSLKRFVRTDT